MHSPRLALDTSIGISIETSSKFPFHDSPHHNAIAGPSSIGGRSRNLSNASSTSSLSIVSPTSASTTASTSSLIPPNSSNSLRSRSASPASPCIDETVRFGPEFVLAMHDYAPQHQNATCLSFRAGQVIRVFNRDTSGWWDGELEGRRGWFPSNYVNADVNSLTDEEPLENTYKRGHSYSKSAASATSWASTSSEQHSNHNRQSSNPEPFAHETDSYCPPVMVPLLQGLSLLQNAVRTNRVMHFQPSTACIISCVRSILTIAGTLQRDAPILKRFSILAEERRRILTVLASLVAQAKKASEEDVEDEMQDCEIEKMLRLAGQVFSHVRRFLAVAVQCGIDLPNNRASVGSSTDTEGRFGSSDEAESLSSTPTHHEKSGGAVKLTMVPRIKTNGQIRHRTSYSMEERSNVGARSVVKNGLAQDKLLRDPHHKHGTSISSMSSISSTSSQGSARAPARPPLPRGPSTSTQVLEVLRHTHDHYLSTIAAFIGHAHSHSRTSHASSTGHLYDLVREIVEMVCKLLTIVEAVLTHPDIPSSRVGSLKSAKEGLYNFTSFLAESVRLLTLSLPPTMSEEDEKQKLIRSATGALKAGADCVAAVKVCLNRSIGERPLILNLPSASIPQPFTPSKFSSTHHTHSSSLSGLLGFTPNAAYDEDLTIQAQTPSPIQRTREVSSGSDESANSKSSWRRSDETRATSPDEGNKLPSPLSIPQGHVEPDLPSPSSIIRTDDGTTWEGSARGHVIDQALEDKIINGDLPIVPVDPSTGFLRDPVEWMLSHDYSLEDVAYNSDGHLVGATMEVLVEKMTPHDSLVDPAFSAVFFLTFRLFSSPMELVDAVIARYNLLPPNGLSMEDLQLWQQRKGIPVRLRVSNFIKTWVELHWRSKVDDPALPTLTVFTRDGLSLLFPGPAERILELLHMREQTTDQMITPKGDRSRDPGMSINPPSAGLTVSEIPRPTMTKTLLVALRKKDFANIAITDFDALELARQLTIMECQLYCVIQPDEILETGQEGATLPVNVRAVSSLSTVITGWVAECILNEPDIKKRAFLIKFFIKVADRCTTLNNYSTSRSILAALDSSTISRLHQTWLGIPSKYKSQLEALRRLADHSRNYHEYRSRLRNTAPPAVPFLGLYLTDVTFCREGNPSHRASPVNASKKLLNFNKYHKLARIVQDMQRFQVSYTLKAIPEVQEYLNIAFEKARNHGDLQDLYRRSLLVEPKQPADTPPTGDMRQLFNWATRSLPQTSASS